MFRVAVLVLLLKSDLIFGENAASHSGSTVSHVLKPELPNLPTLHQQTHPPSATSIISPRYRRNSKDLNFLRLYLCESGYQNCMPDERYVRETLDDFQNSFLNDDLGGDSQECP